MQVPQERLCENNDLRRPAILVLSDAIGATQLVNFSRPLAADVASGHATLRLVSHDQIAGDSEAKAASIWKDFAPTVLVMSRYSESAAGAFVRRARADGIPVLCHLDDNLFAVPESLGSAKYSHYNAPARLAALRSALDDCDLIFASTDILAHELHAYRLRPPIVAGEIACAMEAAEFREVRRRPEPVFGYMASGSHQNDLNLVLPAIEGLLDEVPAATFELFGSLPVPARLSRFGARIVHHPPLADYSAFLDRLAELGWWAGLAPLENTPFNRCKTEIKWLEYTAAGIPTVASDMAVYRRPNQEGGIRLATDADDWASALRALLHDPDAGAEFVSRSRERARETYSMERLRTQLYEIIATAATCSLRNPVSVPG